MCTPSSSPILLMSPSSWPCFQAVSCYLYQFLKSDLADVTSSPPYFQDVSCHLCPFLQSHLAHLAYFSILHSVGELPSLAIPPSPSYSCLCPTLLSGCELWCALVPSIPSGSCCLLHHLAHTTYFPTLLTSLTSPPCSCHLLPQLDCSL